MITRALGIRPTVDVAIRTEPMLAGDLYVLCTDGLSGMVEDPQLLEILSRGRTLERAVAELVDAANRNGGTDNVTNLLLECVVDVLAQTPGASLRELRQDLGRRITALKELESVGPEGILAAVGS